MNYKKITAAMLGLIVLGIIVLSSCDVKNPTEGLEVRLKNISRTNYVTVNIVDGNSGQAITKPIKATFGGENKDKVINSANESISELTITNGIAQFAVLDNIEPTVQNPFKVILVFNDDNDEYINTSLPIRLTKSGISKFTAVLTDLNNLPQGVVSNEEQSGTTDNNGTSEDIEVSSGKESQSNASATVKIPAGTQLLDENGNVLTGNVETRVTYYNPKNQQSLASFPGGLFVTAEQSGGQMSDGSFVTAGFVAVDMNVNGNEVEGFSKNVQIDVEVPQDLTNPETGSPVQPGDEIPLWSYNEDDGEWKFEGNTTVPNQPASGQNYKISYKKVKHLSYWNLDWFSDDYCEEGVQIDFIATSGCFDKVNARLLNQNTGEPLTYSSQTTIYGYDPTLIFQYAPLGTPITVEVYEFISYYENGELLGSINIDDICGTGEVYPLEFTPPQSNFELITVNVEARCNDSDNPTVVSLDGYPIYAKKDGEWYYNYIGELQEGQMQVCLEMGAKYYFMALYKNDWYYSQNYNEGQPYTIDKTEFDFIIEDEPEICDDL
jgi:hypothetical protein